MIEFITIRGARENNLKDVTLHSVLRLLFSRVGEPSAGGAIAYSFNDPRGACPDRGGLGKKGRCCLGRFPR